MTRITLPLLALLVSLSLVACASPTQPTAPPRAPTLALKTTDLTYAINVPDPALAIRLAGLYPDGVRKSPREAQGLWDYTAAYGGSPNVYYGPTAPQCEYQGVGIVVAPEDVAGMEIFGAADWPGGPVQPGVVYAWLGRFAFAAVPASGSYQIDPSGASCWHPGK